MKVMVVMMMAMEPEGLETATFGVFRGES